MRHHQCACLFWRIGTLYCGSFHHCSNAGIDRAIVDKILQLQTMCAGVGRGKVQLQLLLALQVLALMFYLLALPQHLRLHFLPAVQALILE